MKIFVYLSYKSGLICRNDKTDTKIKIIKIKTFKNFGFQTKAVKTLVHIKSRKLILSPVRSVTIIVNKKLNKINQDLMQEKENFDNKYEEKKHITGRQNLAR